MTGLTLATTGAGVVSTWATVAVSSPASVDDAATAVSPDDTTARVSAALDTMLTVVVSDVVAVVVVAVVVAAVAAAEDEADFGVDFAVGLGVGLATGAGAGFAFFLPAIIIESAAQTMTRGFG